MTIPVRIVAAAALASSVLVPLSARGRQAAAPQKTEAVPGTPIPVQGSKIWIGREKEIEEYLKTAHVQRVEAVPVGVTHPRRAYFDPGGPVASVAFKNLMPSRQSGFWESYKAEIAAYELDKVLDMRMVPPTVERKVNGATGSAQLWVEHCTLLREKDTTKSPDMAAYNRQVYRQRVWDNLVGNIDRNQGNLLIDEAWNLILIDHSRAFTATMKMPFPMNRIDRELYGKIKALDEPTLKAALGRWLFDGPKPILQRRDKIVEHFDGLIAKYGEAGVLIP
jgi:hypothetical protein